MPSKFFRPPQTISDQMRQLVVSSSVVTEIAEGTVVQVNSDGTIQPPASGQPNFPLMGVTNNLCSGGDDCWVTLIPNPAPTGGGGGPALQVDGTPNADQSLLNLVAGTGITVTDEGAGAVSIAASGGPPPLTLQKATITLTAAQILALNVTPVELVPAPGSGLYIVPWRIVIEFTHVTTAYTIVGTDNGGLIVGGANNTIGSSWESAPSAWGGFIDQFNSQLTLGVDDDNDIEVSTVVNQPLNVFSTNLLQGGDGTLTYNVYYTIETAV